jgi:hypothetical protein
MHHVNHLTTLDNSFLIHSHDKTDNISNKKSSKSPEKIRRSPRKNDLKLQNKKQNKKQNISS